MLQEIYVLAASFVVGAVILVVEIVGTRMISPYYGASIYVWSSLIGVTLASLAVGYFLGGWAADLAAPSGSVLRVDGRRALPARRALDRAGRSRPTPGPRPQAWFPAERGASLRGPSCSSA